MKVAVVKYNAGNTGSVANALRRAGITPVLTDDAETLCGADKVIFPGVGEASAAMAHLREKGLDRIISRLRQPVLGICLGMQLLCEETEENSTRCLGIIPAKVRRFDRGGLKVPHIGWNGISQLSGELFKGICEGSYVYFVHGYYVDPCPFASAVCEYGHEFSAAVGKDNFRATQFHPEKSGDIGERILHNFLNMEGLRR